MLGPLMIDIEGTNLSSEEHSLLQHRLVGGVILFARNYENPELEDWLELLNSVRRRIQRNLIPEIEEDRLISKIKEHYPEAKP